MTTIEEVAGWLRVAAPYFDEKTEREYLTRAAQVEAMGWRPIEEAQRSIEDRYLLCNGVTVVIGYWDGSRWVNERSPFRSTYPATHFMPLPQPPVKN